MPRRSRSSRDPFGVVVIAASAGGIRALFDLLEPLPAGFPIPILVAQHLPRRSYRSGLPVFIGNRSRLAAKWAEDGDMPRAGNVYICPPNRHLVLAADGSLAVQTNPEISFFKPVADLLFGSAAQIFGAGTIGIVLSGLLADGTLGAAAINRAGGITMAQSAASSEYFDMPASAIDIGRADVVAAPAQLARYLMLLAEIGVSKHAA